MEILKKLAYEKPTPIQTQTIPAIMSGTQQRTLFCCIIFKNTLIKIYRQGHNRYCQNWQWQNTGIFAAYV